VPTYAYRCTVCQHAFDVHQGFHDDALTVCPQCEGRLRKVFSPVGVVFKGSGFYRTDARGSSSATPSSAKPDAAGSSESTGSEKTAGEGTAAKSPAPSEPSAAPAKQPATTAS